MKNNFKDFINSRVEMTPKEFCKEYYGTEHIEGYFGKDVIKLQVYLCGTHIEVYKNDFGILICNTHTTKKTLAEAEIHLWNDFAEAETKFT